MMYNNTEMYCLWLSVFIVFLSICIIKCCEYGELELSKEERDHDGGKLVSGCVYTKFKPWEDIALQWFVGDYLVRTCTKATREDDLIICNLDADLPLRVRGVLKCSVLNKSKNPKKIECTKSSKITVRDQPRITVDEGRNGSLLDVYTGEEMYVATCRIQKAFDGYTLNWLLGNTSISTETAHGKQNLSLALHLENVSKRSNNMNEIRCVYQNDDGFVMDEFIMKLIVQDPPKIEVTGLNKDVVTVKYGEEISATCSVTNALRNKTLQWILSRYLENYASTGFLQLNSTNAFSQRSSSISLDLRLEGMKKYHNSTLSCMYRNANGYLIKQKVFTVLVSGMDGGDSVKWEHVVIGVLGVPVLCSIIAAIIIWKRNNFCRGAGINELNIKGEFTSTFVKRLQRRPLPEIPKSEEKDSFPPAVPPGYMVMHPSIPQSSTYDLLKNEAKDEPEENTVYEVINESTEEKVRINASTPRNIQTQNITNSWTKPKSFRFSIRLNSIKAKKRRSRVQSADMAPVLSIRLKSSNNSPLENIPRERTLNKTKERTLNRPREIMRNDYTSVLKEQRNMLRKVQP